MADEGDLEGFLSWLEQEYNETLVRLLGEPRDN